MSIYINDTKLTHAPTGLAEEVAVVSSTQTAINGNQQQIVAGSNKKVTMAWDWAKPALVKYFEDLAASGETVTYKNDDSKKYGALEFSGVIAPLIPEITFVVGRGLCNL